MSLSDRSRRKAKMVAKKAVEEKWEVTLLTELWAEKEGLVWMGDGESLCAIVHGRKAGILLWGPTLKQWCEEGQQMRRDDRVVARGKSRWKYIYIGVYAGGQGQQQRGNRGDKE